MTRRKWIGILRIAVSIALIVFFAREVSAHITLTGHGIGASTIYDVPYPFHGPLVVLAGVGAVAAFLVALHLLGRGNKR